MTVSAARTSGTAPEAASVDLGAGSWRRRRAPAKGGACAAPGVGWLADGWGTEAGGGLDALAEGVVATDDLGAETIEAPDADGRTSSSGGGWGGALGTAGMTATTGAGS